MKTTIYLAHALTGAPKIFLKRMEALRAAIAKIPDVEVLRFAWVNGGTDPLVINVYQHDMARVRICDLFVSVSDYRSDGNGMEIQARCGTFKPLMVFEKRGGLTSKIIRDCIRYHKEQIPSSLSINTLYDMPDPIQYRRNHFIVAMVEDWVRKHQNPQGTAPEFKF